MKRRRHHFSFSEWGYTLAAVLGPTLLGVTLVLLSSLAFGYVYRNDLLVFAAQHRMVRGVKLLTSLGAHAVAATDIYPEPALIEYLHALQIAKTTLDEGTQILEPLLNAGASLTERNSGGWTPLMIAASGGKLSIVQALVEKGAEIDARAIGGEQTEGMTALMAAAMHGHTDVVRYLVDRGANVHLRARAGYTAMLISASRGHQECVEILLARGASVPSSTVQVAERNGYPEIARRLREARPSAPSSVSRRPMKFPEE